jgi:hypothetical protein
LIISSAALSNGTNVTLTLGNPFTGRYLAIVSNLRDIAATPNTISPNPSIAAVGFQGPLLVVPSTNSTVEVQPGSIGSLAPRGVRSDTTIRAPDGSAVRRSFGFEPDD